MLLRAHAKPLIAVATSIAFHSMIFAARAGGQPRGPEVLTTEVELEPPPAPPPPAPAAEPPEQLSHAESTPAPAQHPQAEARPAAPAAAAGRTLTAPDDAPGGGDLADFSLVQGEGDTYAGGATAAARDTKTTPSAAPSAAPAPARVVRPAPTLAPQDLSRPARPASLDWDCSHLFPSDERAPDSATVVLTVTVSQTGRPASVAIQRDPGHGFAAAARSCASGQRYLPALDREGVAVASTTAPITVFFTR